MNYIDSTALGSAIRQQRKKLGVTQKELALTCGTGLRFISDLEKGKSSCQLGLTLKVIQALGMEFHLINPNEPA